MPLPEALRKKLHAVLLDILPVWLAEAPLDHRRSPKPTSPSSFAISIELYRGVQTWLSFQRKLEARADMRLLDDAIRSELPILNGYIRSPSTMSETWLQDTNAKVGAWLARVCEIVDTGQRPDDAIGLLLDELDLLVSTARTTFQSRSLLAGLTLPDGVTSIPLADGIELRQLSEIERSELGRHDIHVVPRHDITRAQLSTALIIQRAAVCTLSTQPHHAPYDAEFGQSIEDEISLVIRALHIVKEGCTTRLASYMSLVPAVLPGMDGHSMHQTSTNPFARLTLSIADVSPLQSIYSKLRKTRSEVTIAAGRLTDAENRTSPVDALLDATIGLEVLLNPVDDAELAFRTALNFAYLAGAEERRSRFDNVRAVQKTRNRIVHSGFNLLHAKASTIHEHAALAKACLRDAIQRFLSDTSLSGEQKLDADFWLNRIIPPQIGGK